MPAEPIIFHWAPEDDPDGNWQHVFEGHDVEQEEVEAFIERYWDRREEWVERRDKSIELRGLSETGRPLFAVFRVLDEEPPRVYVITCYPIGV